MNTLKNLKGVCAIGDNLYCIIEQSPRKRTILTGHYGDYRGSYYVALPYVQFVFTMSHYVAKNYRAIGLDFSIGMSKMPFNFEEKPETYPVPLPNISGLYVCNSEIVSRNIEYKSKKNMNVNKVTSDLSKKIDEIIADFWNSPFVGHGDGYPDERDNLEYWEELSKEDDLAAFELPHCRFPQSFGCTSYNETIKSPNDFSKILKKCFRLK